MHAMEMIRAHPHVRGSTNDALIRCRHASMHAHCRVCAEACRRCQRACAEASGSMGRH
jgi:hypothetical protein